MMRRAVVAAALAALLAWGPAMAHHSFAMFDLTKTVVLKGVVKEFQWTNPHAWLEIDVPGESGALDLWGVEFNSPNNLSRAGWKRTMMKPGDKVMITIAPLRDGKKGGLFLQAVLADGKTMTDPMMRLRGNLPGAGASGLTGSSAPQADAQPGKEAQ